MTEPMADGTLPPPPGGTMPPPPGGPTPPPGGTEPPRGGIPASTWYVIGGVAVVLILVAALLLFTGHDSKSNDAASTTTGLPADTTTSLAITTTASTTTSTSTSTTTTAPPTTTTTEIVTTTTTGSSGVDLTTIDWKNRTYPVTCGILTNPTLVNGAVEASSGMADGSIDGFAISYGDVTSGPGNEAVVSFNCHTGNNNFSGNNLVYESSPSGPVLVGLPFAYADDYSSTAVPKIVNGVITTLDPHWANGDPHCCPSSNVTHYWHYTGGSWIASTAP